MSQIEIRIDEVKDPLLYYWCRQIQSRYTRKVNKTATFAIKYFLQTGQFLTLARLKQMDNNCNYTVVTPKSKYFVLRIDREDYIENWLEELRIAGFTKYEAVKLTLLKSIEIIDDDDQEEFKSFSELAYETKMFINPQINNETISYVSNEYKNAENSNTQETLPPVAGTPNSERRSTSSIGEADQLDRFLSISSKYMREL